jgi:nicotinamidase/pyrazinamidase
MQEARVMSRIESAAVIVVDVQADFMECHNGALAVPDTGSSYVERTIEATREFKDSGLHIFATRDYHPKDHVSFFTSHPGKKPLEIVEIEGRQQMLWPPHCVQGTPGAEILIPPNLITAVISTGDRSEFESYSGFRDDGGRDTGLKDYLKQIGAKEVIIFGLATDYCVKATVLHALEEGYSVTFLDELSRGITPEGTTTAIEEMRTAGAKIKISND